MKTKTKTDREPVWSSLKGNHISGTVISHLVNADRTATLCGKPKGRMYDRGYSFDKRTDCKLCVRISEKTQA